MIPAEGLGSAFKNRGDRVVLYDRARYWNVTPEEISAVYPCDRYLDVPFDGFIRAIDVKAPAHIVFRWFCQLKVAPYSYDWIDNLGRRSPHVLTPGTEHLEQGQRFLVGRIVEFERDRHISCIGLPELIPVFGRLALTYSVRSLGGQSSRIVVKLNVAATGLLQRVRRFLLAWGDLFMMRKQLYVLKNLSERQFQDETGTPEQPGKRNQYGSMPGA